MTSKLLPAALVVLTGAAACASFYRLGKTAADRWYAEHGSCCLPPSCARSLADGRLAVDNNAEYNCGRDYGSDADPRVAYPQWAYPQVRVLSGVNSYCYVPGDTFVERASRKLYVCVDRRTAWKGNLEPKGRGVWIQAFPPAEDKFLPREETR